MEIDVGLEILGLCAGGTVLLSYVFKDMLKLRIVNLIGSILWLIYGIKLGALSLLILNVSAILFHSYRIWKDTRNLKKFQEKS